MRSSLFKKKKAVGNLMTFRLFEQSLKFFFLPPSCSNKELLEKVPAFFGFKP